MFVYETKLSIYHNLGFFTFFLMSFLNFLLICLCKFGFVHYIKNSNEKRHVSKRIKNEVFMGI